MIPTMKLKFPLVLFISVGEDPGPGLNPSPCITHFHDYSQYLRAVGNFAFPQRNVIILDKITEEKFEENETVAFSTLTSLKRSFDL